MDCLLNSKSRRVYRASISIMSPNKFLKTFALFTLLLLVAAPSVLAVNAVSARNERLALGQLRRFYDIEANFFRNHGDNEVFGNAGELLTAGLIDEQLVVGGKYGYVFSITTINGVGYSDFQITARPLVYGKTGVRSFFLNSANKIQGGDKGGAAAVYTDPEIEDAGKPYLMLEAEQLIISQLRGTLNPAEKTYLSNYGQFTQNLGTLWSLGMVGPELGRQMHRNFAILTYPGADSSTGFAFNAIPIFNYREVRSFYVDQTGLVRAARRGIRDTRVGPNDPVVD